MNKQYKNKIQIAITILFENKYITRRITIVPYLCRRLQNIEEQEAVRRHPDARRPSRVVCQVRAADSRHGRLGVTLPVGHGHGRRPAGGRRSGHPSAAQRIFVAWFAVRVPVRYPIVATAVPRGRVSAALGVLSVPAAAAEQHSVPRRRLRLLRAAGGRQLDRSHRGRRRRRRGTSTVQTAFVVVVHRSPSCGVHGRGTAAAVRATIAATHVPARVPQGGGHDGQDDAETAGGTGAVRWRVVRPERLQVLPAPALPRGTVGRRGRHALRQLRLRGPVRHQAGGLLQHGARHRVRSPQEQPLRGPRRQALRPTSVAVIGPSYRRRPPVLSVNVL